MERKHRYSSLTTAHLSSPRSLSPNGSPANSPLKKNLASLGFFRLYCFRGRCWIAHSSDYQKYSGRQCIEIISVALPPLAPTFARTPTLLCKACFRPLLDMFSTSTGQSYIYVYSFFLNGAFKDVGYKSMLFEEALATWTNFTVLCLQITMAVSINFLSFK